MRSPEKKQEEADNDIQYVTYLCQIVYLIVQFFLFPVNNGINVDNVTSRIDTGVMSLQPYLKLCDSRLNATVNMLTC